MWLPPMGLYCRGSLVSHDAAVKAAAQFAGVHSDRPICIGGAARLRQPHCTIPRGGTYADIAASHYYACIHAKDGRWKLRSSIAVPNYLGMFWRMSSAMRSSTFPLHYPSAVCVNVFVVSIMTLFFRKTHVVLLHAFGLLRLVACLPLSLMCPQFGFDTDRTIPS